MNLIEVMFHVAMWSFVVMFLGAAFFLTSQALGWRVAIGAAIVIALLSTLSLNARADCRQFFVKRQAVIVQQVAVPVYPPVYYSAGGDIQAEALAEKVARLVEGRLALRQQQTAPPASLVAQKCAKCHSGPNAKGGITLDGSALACHQVTEAIRQIAADKMPKGGPVLPPEVKGQLLQELLDLESKPSPDGELQ